MFISSKEKTQIEEAIKGLCIRVEHLGTEVLYLSGKIKALEGNKKPPKKQMSEAQRAKQREYAKRYKAKKQLEKQNGNSVSTPSV